MTSDTSTIAATLRRQLSGESGRRVYGVVDGARCVDLAFEAKIHFGVQIRSLFLPELQARLWNVSPYLVPIDLAGDYLENWARRWGESAGVLLVSAAEEEPLYQHLRKIFVVQDEQQQEFFFRFYDPRVLRNFLPTCSPAQLDEFFGPVEAIAVESDAGEALLRFTKQNGKLMEERLNLSSDAGIRQHATRLPHE